jgi:hypothetical protein
MKHTVESIARATGLAPSSVQKYAWSMKLGQREGRKMVFTDSEARKLGLGKKRPTSGKLVSRTRSVAVQPVAGKEVPKVESKPAATERRSLWGVLGIGKKPKAKVSLITSK